MVKTVKAYLDWKTQNGTWLVMYWPPQSPDQNMWDHIDRKWNKRKPSSKKELWNDVQEAWRTISKDYLKKWQKRFVWGCSGCFKTPNTNFKACYNYVHVNTMFARVSINPCSHFLFSWQFLKKRNNKFAQYCMHKDTYDAAAKFGSITQTDNKHLKKQFI